LNSFEKLPDAKKRSWLLKSSNVHSPSLHGPLIAVDEPGAERADPAYRDVLLDGRLRRSRARLNPDLPPEVIEDAYRKLTRSDAPSLVERNRERKRAGLVHS